MNFSLSTGSQIVLKAGGVTIGGARSMTVSQDFGVEAGYVVGSIMPVELTPQRWAGTIELDKFYIRKDVGIGANIDVSSQGILRIDPVDIEVIDRDSKKSLFLAKGCVLTSSSVTVTANAFTGERASLQALSIRRGEVGTPVLPTGL